MLAVAGTVQNQVVTPWIYDLFSARAAKPQDCHVHISVIPLVRHSPCNICSLTMLLTQFLSWGLYLDRVPDEQGHVTVLQVFAEAEVDGNNRSRGMRHIMKYDSGVHSTRCAKAAVGGLLVGAVGNAQLYVSGACTYVYPQSANAIPKL